MWNSYRSGVGSRYYIGGLDSSFVLQQSIAIDLEEVGQLRAKNWRLAFYEMNYDAIEAHIQQSSRKRVVGAKLNRCCRFCGNTERSGRATFKLKAHGFPRLIGNHTFYTNYECDDCNKMFGDGIENQLGIYLKPYRTLAAIRGHKKYPAIKNEKEGWKIWRDENGLNIQHHDGKRVAHLADDGKTLSISIPRDPYCPLDVYKAFVKMALALMPESEIDQFKSALVWIRNEADFVFYPPTISTTFVEGPPVNIMSAMLLRRRYHGRELPYCMALFLIANTQFQLMIPCLEKDEYLRNKRMSFPSYPMPPEINGEGHCVYFEEVDLSESRVMTDEIVRYDFAFEERIETSSADAHSPSVPTTGITSAS